MGHSLEPFGILLFPPKNSNMYVHTFQTSFMILWIRIFPNPYAHTYCSMYIVKNIFINVSVFWERPCLSNKNIFVLSLLSLCLTSLLYLHFNQLCIHKFSFFHAIFHVVLQIKFVHIWFFILFRPHSLFIVKKSTVEVCRQSGKYSFDRVDRHGFNASC